MIKSHKLRIWLILLAALIVLAGITVPAGAQNAPAAAKYSRFKISYWPEYDSQSVLLIFRGELPSGTALPATVKVLIPKGAKVSSTAAVDPNGKFQYDQAWATHKVTAGENYDVLTYETVYPRFQCEMYFNQIGQAKQRDFNFKVMAPVNIDNMEVEIQEPLKATDFKITPETSATTTNDGFKYYLYDYRDQSPGQEYAFNVKYKKNTTRPSTTSQNQVVNPKSRNNAVIFLVALVVLIGGGAAAAVWRSRTTSTTPRKKKGGRYPTGKYSKKTKKKFYCGECGAELKKKDKFCPKCGEPVK